MYFSLSSYLLSPDLLLSLSPFWFLCVGCPTPCLSTRCTSFGEDRGTNVLPGNSLVCTEVSSPLDEPWKWMCIGFWLVMLCDLLPCGWEPFEVLGFLWSVGIFIWFTMVCRVYYKFGNIYAYIFKKLNNAFKFLIQLWKKLTHLHLKTTRTKVQYNNQNIFTTININFKTNIIMRNAYCARGQTIFWVGLEAKMRDTPMIWWKYMCVQQSIASPTHRWTYNHVKGLVDTS